MKTIFNFVKACYQTYAKWYESRTWHQKACIYAIKFSVVLYVLINVYIACDASARAQLTYLTPVRNGDTISIVGPVNGVEISVYSESLPGGITQLWQGQTLILETVEGAKPGYYQYTGFINPGEYTVVGQTATVVLAPEMIIVNNNEIERSRDLNKKSAIAAFLVASLVGYVAGRGLYRPRP